MKIDTSVKYRWKHLFPIGLNLPYIRFGYWTFISESNNGGVVVKLLACGASGPGSIFGLATTISEISCFQVAIWLKYRKSDVNPQNYKPSQTKKCKTFDDHNGSVPRNARLMRKIAKYDYQKMWLPDRQTQDKVIPMCRNKTTCRLIQKA